MPLHPNVVTVLDIDIAIPPGVDYTPFTVSLL